METDTIEKTAETVKVAVKLRIKPPKRRDPASRLKARLYYRKNRSKIRVQRRRYMRTQKSTLKHRKQFMRYKPKWFKRPSQKSKSKPKKVKFNLLKTTKPKKPKAPAKPKAPKKVTK